MKAPINQVVFGDCRESTRQMIADGVKVQMCVTSPPYFGLRDYGHAGQIGLESTPSEFVAAMVEVFGLVCELLSDDGVLWLNLGDSYSNGGRKTRDPGQSKLHPAFTGEDNAVTTFRPDDGAKPKDLLGIPWRVAFALQADGWYLRQDIIWHKPNPMPESVTDRCTKAHEYLFLLSKNERYYYDHDAIREPCKPSSIARVSQDVEHQEGSDRVPGKTNGKMKAVKFGGNKQCPDTRLQSGKEWHPTQGGSGFTAEKRNIDASGNFTANKKSVWTVPTKPYKEAHFATFPPALIEPCILAGSRVGDIVLDPFFGSGTTGQVSQALGRQWIGCELNPAYEHLQLARTAQASLLL